MEPRWEESIESLLERCAQGVKWLGAEPPSDSPWKVRLVEHDRASFSDCFTDPRPYPKTRSPFTLSSASLTHYRQNHCLIVINETNETIPEHTCYTPTLPQCICFWGAPGLVEKGNERVLWAGRKCLGMLSYDANTSLCWVRCEIITVHLNPISHIPTATSEHISLINYKPIDELGTKTLQFHCTWG